MREGLQSEAILGSSGPCSELPSPGNKDIVHPALASLCEKHKISVRRISQNISPKNPLKLKIKATNTSV